MGGQFSPKDPKRCPHYARFAAHLDRPQFDGIYWTFFCSVILILFVSSWIFQSTMRYREKPEHCESTFRRKLKISLAWCTSLFLLAAILLVFEVFALLALQFCDGEDLMSLYWSTWTMLQLGSEIAILGINLAMWHHLFNVRQPLWALALGTPVLVVAGLGHIIHVAFRVFYKKAKENRRASREVRSNTARKMADVSASTSTAPSIKPEREHVDQASDLIAGQTMCFAIDVGDDERVRQWPSFVGMSGGKAIVRLTAIHV
ncbi:uncharacterized protein GGS22DRAFT_69515 [Annulohypoxylon maeteangense]|uniref:uncharacterized protein n=1 Tax=Annulohypoxylon maeteangense TaxID=1927788 RepID=UPI0020077B42|nr:uncharacterized protein GGS22DRAFT_69515 [Annulohypoxylon maeteangense]KAI0889282.1 hypothetical protein GGS22DRAFT_69515 [Annulohypoxylon maeteangense]